MLFMAEGVSSIEIAIFLGTTVRGRTIEAKSTFCR